MCNDHALNIRNLNFEYSRIVKQFQACAAATVSAFVPRVSLELNFNPVSPFIFFDVQPSSRILARKLVSKVILSRGYMKLRLTSFPTETSSSPQRDPRLSRVYWNRPAILKPEERAVNQVK